MFIYLTFRYKATMAKEKESEQGLLCKSSQSLTVSNSRDVSGQNQQTLL